MGTSSNLRRRITNICVIFNSISIRRLHCKFEPTFRVKSVWNYWNILRNFLHRIFQYGQTNDSRKLLWGGIFREMTVSQKRQTVRKIDTVRRTIELSNDTEIVSLQCRKNAVQEVPRNETCTSSLRVIFWYIVLKDVFCTLAKDNTQRRRIQLVRASRCSHHRLPFTGLFLKWKSLYFLQGTHNLELTRNWLQNQFQNWEANFIEFIVGSM